MLFVVVTVERIGFRRQGDCRHPGHSTERFAGLSELWQAVNKQKVKVVREDLKRKRKMRKDPNAYICAAEGCGIEATHKAALRACSGKCAKEGKPAYCSKECQKKVSKSPVEFYLTSNPYLYQDWTRHKMFCREGALVDELAASRRQELPDDDPDMITAESINLTDPKWGPHSELFMTGSDDKPSFRLDFPNPHGGTVKVNVTGMDPATSKKARDEAERILEARRRKQ